MDLEICLACNGTGFEYQIDAEFIEITHLGSDTKQYMCVRPAQSKLCDYCYGGYRGWTDRMLRPYSKDINTLFKGGYINENNKYNKV